MSKQERKRITRLALVLAVLLLIAVFAALRAQFDSSYDAARRAIENFPPIVVTVDGE